MTRDKKIKSQIFNGVIDSLQKQIKNLGKLMPQLENKEKELKEFERNLNEHVNTRTSAERIIHRQLHHEIEHRKKLEQKVQDALEYANAIIDTVRDPLIILDKDLKVISASASFYKVFKEERESTKNKHIYDLGNSQWDIAQLRKLLEEILPSKKSFEGFEVEHDFPNIGRRTMLLNARQIYNEKTKEKLILLAIEDITERKEAEDKLKILASRDELTGCLNFRSIMGVLENELARCRRYKKEFSVVMMDIDQFKMINDDYGHLVGNDALVFLSDVLKKSARSIDVIGRYGGDEFILILPESSLQNALEVLERIKNDLKKTKVASSQIKNGKGLTLKISAGIATFPENATDVKGLISFADEALLETK